MDSKPETTIARAILIGIVLLSIATAFVFRWTSRQASPEVVTENVWAKHRLEGEEFLRRKAATMLITAPDGTPFVVYDPIAKTMTIEIAHMPADACLRIVEHGDGPPCSIPRIWFQRGQ